MESLRPSPLQDVDGAAAAAAAAEASSVPLASSGLGSVGKQFCIN